jgi:hypothetical protein
MWLGGLWRLIPNSSPVCSQVAPAFRIILIVFEFQARSGPAGRGEFLEHPKEVREVGSHGKEMFSFRIPYVHAKGMFQGIAFW